MDDCGEYGRRSLIQVAKKIKKALKRAAGFGERNHIFVSDAIAQQFRADFLVDASYCKPSDQCGRDSISSRSSSVESLAGPRALGDLFRSGLPRSPSSHDFDDVVDLEGLEDNGSNLNPIMHSDPLVGQGALSVPIQGDSGHKLGAQTSAGAPEDLAHASRPGSSRVRDRQEDSPAKEFTRADLDYLMRKWIASRERSESRYSDMRSFPSGSRNVSPNRDPRVRRHAHRDFETQESDRDRSPISRALVPSIRQPDSEDESREAFPPLRHWPEVSPVTYVDSSVRRCLEQDEPPERYSLGANPKVDENGWQAPRYYFTYKEVFVGCLEGELFVCFIAQDSRAGDTAKSLKVFSPGEEKSRRTLARRTDELVNVAKWNKSRIPEMFLANRDGDGNVKFHLRKVSPEILKLAKLAKEDKLSHKHIHPPWSFSCDDQALQGVLDNLQAEMLGSEAHVLEGVGQRFTAELSSKDRTNDFRARAMAQIHFSSNCLLETAVSALAVVEKDKDSSLSNEAKSALYAAQTLIDVVAQVDIGAFSTALKVARDTRAGLKDQACGKIKPWEEVGHILKKGAMEGEGLFSQAQVEEARRSLEGSGQRKVATNQGKLWGKAKRGKNAPKPSLGENSHQLVSLLKDLQRSGGGNANVVGERRNSKFFREEGAYRGQFRGSKDFRSSHNQAGPSGYRQGASSQGRGGGKGANSRGGFNKPFPRRH